MSAHIDLALSILDEEGVGVVVVEIWLTIPKSVVQVFHNC